MVNYGLQNIGAPRPAEEDSSLDSQNQGAADVFNEGLQSNPPVLQINGLSENSASASGSASSSAVGASGSGLSFQNTFGADGTFASLSAAEQAALKVDLQQAELDLSSEFSNSLIANIDFEAVNVAPVGGLGFLAANAASADRVVSVSSYFSALQSVATSSYQSSAVAAIKNLTDLGGSTYVQLPAAYARMLGLGGAGASESYSSVQLSSTQTYNLSSSVDDTLFLNMAFVQTAIDDQAANTPNNSVVGVLEHELTENVMGRVSSLLTQTGPGNIGAVWAPADFFRVNSAGQSQLTHDNGTAVFFSPDPGVTAPVSSLQFNNSSGGGDFADWTNTSTSDSALSDPFGPGNFNGAVGTETSTLSPADIDLMNVLGWTIASGTVSTPSLTIALENDSGASSTDDLTSDPTLTGKTAASATVTLSENGVSLGTAVADAGGSWSFKPTLADGVQTIVASETASGQTVTASLTFSLATKAPTISASESVSGQTALTSDTITATAAAESVGANAIAGVEIFDGSADLGAATLSNGVWSFTAQSLFPGAHHFTVKATDRAGNVASSALAQLNVTGSQSSGRYTLSAFSFTGDGVTNIVPRGINDSGEVVGFYDDARADQVGADGQTYYEHGFYSTLSNGVRQYYTIDDPGSSTGSPLVQTRATSVNDAGEIVGWYAQLGYGVADNGSIYPLSPVGFISSANWPGGVGALAYSSSGDFGTHALGINANDQIVGFYYDGSGEEHGFLRDFTGYGVRGNYVALDPLNSINTVAEGINASGLIVGYYETSNGTYHGFTYDGATSAYATIDVNGATGTEAIGVNDSGEIVGYYTDSSGKDYGFVRNSDGQITTVDDPNAGTGGTVVSSINNYGEIVGWYTGTDGLEHGFIGTGSARPSVDDFTGSGTSDILLQNGSGGVVDWIVSNGAITGGNDLGTNPGWNPVGTGDFTGNGVSDILMQNSAGTIVDWTMHNGTVSNAAVIGNSVGFNVVGAGDFTGNGTDDILLQNSAGTVVDWIVNNGAITVGNNLGTNPGWKVVGTGDFNGDGTTDVLLENGTGTVVDWTMGNGTVASATVVGNAGGYNVVGTGDFTGDGTADILLQNAAGDLVDWIMSNGAITGAHDLGVNPGWTVAATGDYTGNGVSDILLTNSAGNVVDWTMQNGVVSNGALIGNSVGFTVKH